MTASSEVYNEIQLYLTIPATFTYLLYLVHFYIIYYVNMLFILWSKYILHLTTL